MVAVADADAVVLTGTTLYPPSHPPDHQYSSELTVLPSITLLIPLIPILVLISRIRDNTCDAPALHLVMLRYCSPAFYQTHLEIRTFTDAASISRIMFEQAPSDLRRHANQFLQKRQIAFS